MVVGVPVMDRNAEPLAYYLTWTTYGTWLPGDARGWVEKPGQWRGPDPELEQRSRQLMTEPPVRFDQAQRDLVEATIAAHCQIRGWHLWAVNCRSNHVHVVVTAPGRLPDDVMDQFKAWATRKLKERQRAQGVPVRVNWWTQGGSKQWINDEAGLHEVIQYVSEMQDLPRE